MRLGCLHRHACGRRPIFADRRADSHGLCLCRAIRQRKDHAHDQDLEFRLRAEATRLGLKCPPAKKQAAWGCLHSGSGVPSGRTEDEERRCPWGRGSLAPSWARPPSRPVTTRAFSPPPSSMPLSQASRVPNGEIVAATVGDAACHVTDKRVRNLPRRSRSAAQLSGT